MALPRDAAAGFCREMERQTGLPAWIVGIVEEGDRFNPQSPSEHFTTYTFENGDNRARAPHHSCPGSRQAG